MAKKKKVARKKSSKKAKSASREFELAVCRLVSALNPSATVIFDHKVCDRDTGTPRQVDGWVEAKVLGQYPVSVLLSCKAHKRKVDIQTIGAFVDEVRSTGASFGVIYSTTGFTAPALQKAEVNGLSCCRLYRTQPADLPETLCLWSYCCNTAFRISLIEAPSPCVFRTWGDLFNSTIGSGSKAKTVLDALACRFRRGEDSAIAEARTSATFPNDWAFDFTVGSDDTSDLFVIRTAGYWKLFRSRLEAHILNGSYCFQNKSFVGSITGPFVDTKSVHPGSGWQEISGRALPRDRMMIILFHGDFARAALARYGPELIQHSS